MPSEFSKWLTVYAYFAKRREPDQHGVSVLEQTLKNQVCATRVQGAKHLGSGDRKHFFRGNG
jgi:hypothetical protein